MLGETLPGADLRCLGAGPGRGRAQGARPVATATRSPSGLGAGRQGARRYSVLDVVTACAIAERPGRSRRALLRARCGDGLRDRRAGEAERTTRRADWMTFQLL